MTWSTFDFYPRPPRGGRREILGRFCILYDISIHALREEGDPGMDEADMVIMDFYPRPPRGGRLSHKEVTP